MRDLTLALLGGGGDPAADPAEGGVSSALFLLVEEADEAPSDLPRPRPWPRPPRPSPPVFLDFAGLTLAGLVAPLLALVVDWGIVVVWNAVVERHCFSWWRGKIRGVGLRFATRNSGA